MDYYQRIGRAIDYIEENLKREVPLATAADRAFCSLFHFHRIFQPMVGDTLADYIRKRRLTQAACELVTTDRRIVDIALDYRYESHEAFTRAFRRHYGQSPAQFRKGKTFRILRERAVVRPPQRGEGNGMTSGPKIVHAGPRLAIGMQLRVSSKEGENNKAIPEFWQRYIADRTTDKVPNKKSPWVSLGICGDGEADGFFSYWICEEVTTLTQVPNGMVAKTVPAGLYAVFTCTGQLPAAIQETWKHAYGTWLPSSGYERAETEDFELYDGRSDPNGPDCITEVHIPLKEKQ
jgi:AraC family transcriptional regulator